MCAIDLRLCPKVTSAMTSPSALSPEVCECLGKFSENVYSVYIRQSINASQAGLTLTAVVPAALSNSGPLLSSTHDIGTLPAVKSGHMTYTVNGGGPTILMTSQNITTCKHDPVKLEVCAPTAHPGSILKLTEDGQTITSPQSCIDMTEYFSFQDEDSYPVVFSYDEGAGCPFQESFLFNIYNDQATCAPKTTPTPTLTTTTTTTTTTKPSHWHHCKADYTPPPRQQFTLNNGLNVLCKPFTNSSSGCDWVVIQRRYRGDVDFHMGWTEYVGGFGDVTGDFWIGLQNIHTLCPPSKPCKLMVDMVDRQGYHSRGENITFAQYSNFSLTGWTDKYRLSVDGYYGNAGDGLSGLNGLQFSTYDRTNDAHRPRPLVTNRDHCYDWVAEEAWWRGWCPTSSLNGDFCERGSSYRPFWSNLIYIMYSEMRVRMHP